MSLTENIGLTQNIGVYRRLSKIEHVVLIDDTRLSPETTFTRATSATYFDANGVLQTASSGVLRSNAYLSGISRGGALLEGQRTNSLRNSTMVGTVAGTPGTNPTNWTFVGVSGLTKEIIGTGTLNGFTYIDYRISGTPDITSGFGMKFETNTGIAAANGQTWAGSLYAAIVGGDTTNLGTTRIIGNYRDSGGASLQQINGSNVVSTLTSSLQRITVTGTASNASTTNVTSTFESAVTSGQAIDVTFRIAAPQLELGAFASSFIPTSTAAVTRNNDDLIISNLDTKPWWNPTEGTLLVDFTATQIGVQFAVMEIDDGTTANALLLQVPTAGTLRLNPRIASVDNNITTSGSLTALTNSKAAFAYKANDFAVVRDGGTVATGTGDVPPGLNTLRVGSRVNDQFAYTYFYRLLYYPVRLSNQQLQALTV